MKYAIIFLCASMVLASGEALSLRQLTGICAERCASDTDCAESLRCRSNGCGHTCQPLSQIGLTDCRLTALCNNYCFYGHATDLNGCPTCACRSPVVDPTVLQ